MHALFIAPHARRHSPYMCSRRHCRSAEKRPEPAYTTHLVHRASTSKKNHRPVESSEKRPYRKSRQAKAPPRRADGSARNLDRAGRVHAHRAAAQAAWQRDNSRPLPRVAAARQQLLGAEALTLSASLAHRRGAVRTCKRNAGKGVYVYIYIYICLHASIL